MPLIESILEQKLKSRINALEPKLKNALNSKTGGLYKAQSLIDIKLTDTSPESGFSLLKYKNDVWSTTSEEWSKVLAKEIIKLLSDDLSKIIASEITSYIKSATIIVPPGQVVTAPAPAGVGTTTSPSAPAKIT